MVKPKAKEPVIEGESGPALAQSLTKKTKRRSKTSERREQLSRDLAMEIDALRLALTEMLDRYRYKIDAELLQIGAAARGEAPLDGKATKLPLTATQKMLKLVRDLEIKPQKGRAKDFQKLQRLVNNLVDEMPPEK